MGLSENQIRNFDSFSKALYDLPGFSTVNIVREVQSPNHPNFYIISYDESGNGHDMFFYITAREAAAAYVQWETENLNQTGFRYYIKVESRVPNPMDCQLFISLEHEAQKNPRRLRVCILDDVDYDEDTNSLLDERTRMFIESDDRHRAKTRTTSDDSSSSQYYSACSKLPKLTGTTSNSHPSRLSSEGHPATTVHPHGTDGPEPSLDRGVSCEKAGHKLKTDSKSEDAKGLSPAHRLEIQMWTESVSILTPSIGRYDHTCGELWRICADCIYRSCDEDHSDSLCLACIPALAERRSDPTGTLHAASHDHSEISDTTSGSGSVVYTQQESDEEHDADGEASQTLSDPSPIIFQNPQEIGEENSRLWNRQLARSVLLFSTRSQAQSVDVIESSGNFYENLPNIEDEEILDTSHGDPEKCLCEECMSSLWRSPYSRRGWFFWPQDPEIQIPESDAIGGNQNEERYSSFNDEVLDTSHGSPDKCLCDECKHVLWRYHDFESSWIPRPEGRKNFTPDTDSIGGDPQEGYEEAIKSKVLDASQAQGSICGAMSNTYVRRVPKRLNRELPGILSRGMQRQLPRTKLRAVLRIMLRAGFQGALNGVLNGDSKTALRGVLRRARGVRRHCING